MMKKRPRISRHRKKFLLHNPRLSPVVGSEFEELLRWAEQKNFIEFKLFEGEEFYSELDLELAQMWREKCKDRA